MNKTRTTAEQTASHVSPKMSMSQNKPATSDQAKDIEASTVQDENAHGSGNQSMKRLNDSNSRAHVASKQRRNNGFSSVGAGLIHGQGVPFVNIYTSHILNQRRSQSKGGPRKRRFKKVPNRNNSTVRLDAGDEMDPEVEQVENPGS